MENKNIKEIRTEFLRASYYALFDTCPDSGTLDKLTIETSEDGRQKP